MAEQYQEKGISFPFRVGVKGGTAMRVANSTTPQKIVESYIQILGTNQYERSMEFELFTQIEDFVFHVDNETLRSVAEYLVMEALNRFEPRATCNDVLLTGQDFSDGSHGVICMVNFTVNKTGKTYNATAASWRQ